MRILDWFCLLVLIATSSTVAFAQMEHGMHDPPAPAATPSPSPEPRADPTPTPEPMPGMPMHEHEAMPSDMQMPGHAGMGHEHAAMRGLLGNYPMSREASGTAWQPEEAPHAGLHTMRGAWHLMAHGTAFGIYSHQGSRRGDDDVYSTNMAMGIAERPLGGGTLGLKGMISLEPATVGSSGYPLLLQTGETANGQTPLVDRQHPHDFLMELATSYSIALSAKSSVFLYAGLPGEPALGPPAYMHRFSAMDNPEAPLAHHWLDSTHISWGVVTGGWVASTWKLEGSVFTGREPDQHRWDIEQPHLDSQAVRATWNPTTSWSMQASYGRLHSPEQLEPNIDVDRSTLSASYVAPMTNGRWGATLAWGRNDRRPGRATQAVLIEGTVQWADVNTVFARAERLQNDELLASTTGSELPNAAAEIGEISVGYLHELRRGDVWRLGLGGSGRISEVPSSLANSYGSRHPLSWLLMLRAAVR